jgi:hypothetical protein
MSNCCICRYKRNNKIIAALETHSTGVALSNIINLATSVVRSYGRIECGRSLVQIPSRIKDYEICICCFFDKHPTLSSKSTDWLHVAGNQHKVSEWNDMSTHGLFSVR